MSKLWMLAALALLTTPAASAQEAPMPMLRAPILGAGTVATSGITEQGHGAQYVPADRLKLLIRTYGPPAAPGVMQNPTAMSDAEKAVIEAMKANGIPDARAVSPVLGQVTGNDQIVGTIAKPTHERVLDIETRIIGALPPAVAPALRNTNVGGSLEADSCAAALERARATAFADARKRAESLAAIAGVHLGTLLTATENDQTAGCTDQGPILQAFFSNGNDALSDTNIAVSVYITVSFAIRP